MSDAFVKVVFPNGIAGIYKQSGVNPTFGGMNCNSLNVPFDLAGFVYDGQMYDLEGKEVDGRTFPKMGEFSITRGILSHPALRALIEGTEPTPVPPQQNLETQAAEALGIKIASDNANA